MRGGAGRGCGVDLEHCENAGRIYRPTGVYAGAARLSYEIADLRICLQTSGAISLKRIYPVGFTDLRSYQSINESFITYYRFYSLINYKLRICIRICGAAHMDLRGCLQIYTLSRLKFWKTIYMKS